MSEVEYAMRTVILVSIMQTGVLVSSEVVTGQYGNRKNDAWH
jgi:hypothetical protein